MGQGNGEVDGDNIGLEKVNDSGDGAVYLSRDCKRR